MSKATSAPPGAPSTTPAPPRPVTPEHRVIYHEPICPGCGSFAITETEIDTGDGITEIALSCIACGLAWPVACVVDWDTPTPRGR